MLTAAIKTCNVVTCYLPSSDIPTVGSKKAKNLEVDRFTFVRLFSSFNSINVKKKKNNAKNIIFGNLKIFAKAIKNLTKNLKHKKGKCKYHSYTVHSGKIFAADENDKVNIGGA